MQEKFTLKLILLLAAVIVVAVGLFLDRQGKIASRSDNEIVAKRLIVSSNILCVMGMILTIVIVAVLICEENDPYYMEMLP